LINRRLRGRKLRRRHRELLWRLVSIRVVKRIVRRWLPRQNGIRRLLRELVGKIRIQARERGSPLLKRLLNRLRLNGLGLTWKLLHRELLAGEGLLDSRLKVGIAVGIVGIRELIKRERLDDWLRLAGLHDARHELSGLKLTTLRELVGLRKARLNSRLELPAWLNTGLELTAGLNPALHDLARLLVGCVVSVGEQRDGGIRSRIDVTAIYRRGYGIE